MGRFTEDEKNRQKLLMENGLSECSKCKRILSVDCFYKDKYKWNGICSICKECTKQRDKLKYDKNKDNIIQRVKEWARNNSDKKKEYDKKRYNNNVEEIRQRSREYAKTHKDVRYKWRCSTSGKISERMSNEKRRMLIKNNGGSFTCKEVIEMLSFFDNKCAYTGEPLKDDYHLDHVVSLKNGGTNYIYNIIPCNKEQNLSKHTRDMEEWFREQKYFSEDRLQKIYEWINIKQNEIKGEQNDGFKDAKEAS